jgi:H+/Cl- antiporter ClcA
MAIGNFFQNEILTNFIYPFFMMFFIVFAILEKTKLLGEGRRQLNALIALIISLIFVSVTAPKLIVSNLILFLTIAIVVVFVALLLWGFVSGSDLKADFLKSKAVKGILGAVVIIAVIFAVIWAAGLGDPILDFLKKFNWSGEFFTNLMFVIVIAVALAVAIKVGGGKS